MASKYEELECLYAAVGKVIYEGLTSYEKAASANPSQLFGEWMGVCCAPTEKSGTGLGSGCWKDCSGSVWCGCP